MDRYEYRVREEEIRKLTNEGDYAEAVKIADTIDWSRVKSVKMLCLVSDLYKANHRYQESKEILLMAYDKYPTNRRIVYALCDLSIRLEEFVQAVEYYKEFANMAPHDTDKYILRYRIYEAQDVSLEERAAVLEEYKARDPKPKWCYELAYLYHRMGLSSKCVDECDDLIVTFGEGKYVIKAMELKALHEPLSSSEQQQYNQYITSRDERIMSGEPEPVREDTTAELGSSTLDEADLQEAPTSELPPEEDIQVKTVDVGQYNTVNLQAALAESMKDIWDDGTSEKRLTPSVPEPDVEDNTIFEASPLTGYGSGAEHTRLVQSVQLIQPETSQLPDAAMPEQPAQFIQPQQYVQPVQAPEYTQTVQPEQYAQPVQPQQYAQPAVHEQPAQPVQPPQKELSPLLKQPEPDLEEQYNTTTQMLLEQTKRIPTEAVVDYVETKRLVQEIQVSTAQMQAKDEQASKIPGANTGQLDQDSIAAGLYDQMLAEEYSGQIRLAIAEADKIEKQITGQLSIDDVLADWEQVKKENEKKRDEEVRTRILQHTGSLFDEFDEETKAALIGQLEKAFRDAIIKNSDGKKIDDPELGEKIHDEALRTVKSMAAVAEEVSEEAKASETDQSAEAEETQAGETEEKISEAEDNSAAEKKDAVEAPAEGTDETGAAEKTEDETEAVEEPAEETGAAEEATSSKEDMEAESAVKKALKEDEEESETGRHKKTKPDRPVSVKSTAHHTDGDEEIHHKLSEEEEELFASYLDRKGARKQITRALEDMSMAAYTGNVIVTGGEGVGTLDLAKRLIKYMQATDSNFLGNQVARVFGKNLNDKDLPAMLSQLNGGAIIIQSARGMKKSTVQKLISALENENLGILAILEDTSEGMDKIVGTLPKLGEIFNVRIDLQALDDKALVNYACEYALSQEHSIDEFALLALHTRIAEMQTSAHQVSVAEVRDLVDDACFYADKKTPGHLFDIILHKRYDDEDMVILREKDFMHY